MPSSDAFALSRSGLNEFLFAPVGTEANGMTLSVVSVFARLGNDPWLEASKLARLPKLEATETLGRIIASMPTSIWPLQAATPIAARLVFVQGSVALSRSPPCWCAWHSCWPIKPAFSLRRTDQSLTRTASPASRYRLPVSRPASKTHNRRPRRRDDRHDSRGPLGGSPRACPWHWEDVVFARDVCRFPAMACRSCSAATHATPPALPRLPLRRRIPPSDGLAGCLDAVTSQHSSDFRRSRSRSAVPSERSSAAYRGPWLVAATLPQGAAHYARTRTGSDIMHLGTWRATAHCLTWVRAVHVVRATVEYTPAASFW
jgi:hypothetical protein